MIWLGAGIRLEARPRLRRQALRRADSPGGPAAQPGSPVRTDSDLPEQAGDRTKSGSTHAVSAWLCQHPGWLLILDTHRFGRGRRGRKPCCRESLGSSVLLTSRLTNRSGSVLALPLGVLSPEAAIEFSAGPLGCEATQAARRSRHWRALWPTNSAAWP